MATNGEVKLTFTASGAEAVAEQARNIAGAISGIAQASAGGGDFRGLAQSVAEMQASMAELTGETAEASEALGEFAETTDKATTETDDFSQSADRAKAKTNGLFGGMTKLKIAALAAAAAMIAAAGAAAKFATSGVRGAFEWGADLQHQSAALGASVRDLAILKQALSENGVEAGALTMAVSQMQKRVSEGSKIFKQLGLSAKELKGQGLAEQFRAVGEAINGLASQEDRMRAIMEIFGRGGAQMNQLFSNTSAFEQASATLGSSAAILSKNAVAFERASTLLANIGVKFQGFFAGVAEGVVGPLNMVLEMFNALDLAEKGQRFGDALAYGAEVCVRILDEGISQAALHFVSAIIEGCQTFAFLLAGAVTSAAALFVKGLAVVIRSLTALVGTIAAWIAGADWDDAKRIGNETSRETAVYKALDSAQENMWNGGTTLMKNALTKDLTKETGFDDLIGLKSNSIAELMKDWVPPSQRESQESEKPAFGGVELPSASMPKTQEVSGDALSRVGGYLGPQGQMMMSAEKETANNTRQTNTLLKTISRSLTSNASAATTAVYA